jgi:hypothetical protein
LLSCFWIKHKRILRAWELFGVQGQIQS